MAQVKCEIRRPQIFNPTRDDGNYFYQTEKMENLSQILGGGLLYFRTLRQKINMIGFFDYFISDEIISFLLELKTTFIIRSGFQIVLK